MRTLLRSVAIVSALALPLIAHATPVTYSGTITLTDTTTGANIGAFATDPFSFTDPNTGTLLNPFVDPFSIDGVISKNDQISLNVSFTAPGVGSGDLTGEDFTGIFGGSSIDWSYPAIDQIDLANGSIAYVSLPNLFGAASTPLTSCGTRRSGDVCGSSDLSIYITDNAPATTPEPSSLMLLGTGVLGAAGLLRRRFAL
jgi:hypothetical protein